MTYLNGIALNNAAAYTGITMPAISAAPVINFTTGAQVDYNNFYATMNAIANAKFNPSNVPVTSGSADGSKNQSWLGKVWNKTKNGIKSAVRFVGNLGKDVVSVAKNYLGMNEKDGSYKLFTNGRTEAWCADFVTYVVKETCQKTGKSLPAGFGSPSVSGLRDWGIRNKCYLKTSTLSNKVETIKNNVKSGDIIIFKENGRSHTGIVKEILADGTIKTIEGNTSDKVGERSYSANDRTISGFVQVA